MTSDILAEKARFFDRWAPTYDWLIPSVFYQAIHQRLLAYVQLSEHARVLDIGCGTGRLLNRLAIAYPTITGIGVDLSLEMLHQATQASAFPQRLTFTQGRSDALPFADQQFEAAFCTISFLHYPQPEQVLAEVYRILQPQGRLYLADYTPSLLVGCDRLVPLSPGGLRFYTQHQRETLGLQAGFQTIQHQYLLGPVMMSIFHKPGGGS